jgi:uncharacterized protein (TIGR03083 family)
MTRTCTDAARLPQTDRDQAAQVGDAEGRAAIALLRQLRETDWHKPTDCPEWDVRALVSHLVAQCEDGQSMRTIVRRELAGRRRYPAKTSVDAHMAVQVDEHRAQPGPDLAERFAQLWPRAVQARRRRPAALRRITLSTGIPAMPRASIGYLLDVIYNRDLWMHRLDLARATGQRFTIGDHDRHIVEQVIRDLALSWPAPPVTLELAGPAGGTWLIGPGEPAAVIRAEATAMMRALAGRDDNPALELQAGDPAALFAMRNARVLF